jgi:purine-binding chemotaxis protein CheW
VVFTLHGERYALAIGVVREILPYTPPGATAVATGLIRGLINVRGEVLPVLDLSPRLGRELEVRPGSRIVVVEVTRGLLGVIVDNVDGVQRIPEERIGPLPAALGDNGLGSEVAVAGEELMLLLDAEQALGEALAGPPPPPGDRPAPRPPGAHPPV